MIPNKSNNKLNFIFLTSIILFLLLSLVGCGGKGGGGDDSASSAGRLIMPSNIVMGPSKATQLSSFTHSLGSRVRSLARVFHLNSLAFASVVPRDGEWMITPNKVKIHITNMSLSYVKNNKFEGSGAPVNCEAVYDSSLPSAITLTNCPFITNPGTYNIVNIKTDYDYEILVDDPVNGIYSDPDSPTGFSSDPIGGARMIKYHVDTGNADTSLFPGYSFQAYLATPLKIEKDGVMPELSFIVNGVHKLRLDVSNGTISINEKALETPPVDILPVIGGMGNMEAYSSNRDAGNYLISSGSGIEITVMYDPAGNAVSATHDLKRASLCNSGYKRSVGAAAEKLPFFPDHSRTGGYLGIDEQSIVSFAMPVDPGYETYFSLLELERKTTIGDTTSLRCYIFGEAESVPQPIDGNTYASGAPRMDSVSEELDLYVVAR